MTMMEDAQLYKAIGRELANERDRRNWTWSDVEANGGPTAPTVRDNEAGKIRTLAALSKHAAALETKVGDLVMHVVQRAERDENQPSIQAQALARHFDRQSAKDREAMVVIFGWAPVQDSKRKPPTLPTTPTGSKPTLNGSKQTFKRKGER